MQTIFFRVFILLCFIIKQLNSFAQWNNETSKAYSYILDLRLNEAKTLLKSVNEENVLKPLLQNYIDFYTVFINEDELEFKQLESNKNIYLERIKSFEEQSPYHKFGQAQILIQWAFARVKFKQYVKAFTEIKQAYSLLNENERQFPNFEPNKMGLGVLHILIGTIPDEYKWGANLLGLKGNMNEGFKELEECINSTNTEFQFKKEASIYYGLLMLNVGKKSETAWDVIQRAIGNDYKNSLLSNFILANTASRLSKNDEALRILQARPKSSEYKLFVYLDFMEGLCLLRKMDTKNCIPYFERYITQFKGKSYVKETYEKLGWAYLLQGNTKKYWEYNWYILNKGNTSTESDATAYKFAQKKEIPDSTLLTSRLLFDGGYYPRALDVLQKKTENSFLKLEHKIEYLYRNGRVLASMKRYDEAIKYYTKTLSAPKDAHYYFPAKACLEMGFIFEQRGNREKAKRLYNEALQRNEHEYKNSFEQQARAGLQRVN